MLIHSPFPEAQWRRWEQISRLWAKAVNKNWLAAAEGLRLRRNQALREFQDGLDRMLADAKRPMLPACPSLGEVYAELMGVVAEFPEVEFDLRGDTLSVVTDPVPSVP